MKRDRYSRGTRHVILFLMTVFTFPVMLAGCYRPPAALPDIAVAPFDFDKGIPLPPGSKQIFTGGRNDGGYYSKEYDYQSDLTLAQLEDFYRPKLQGYGLREFGLRRPEGQVGANYDGWPGGMKVSFSVVDHAVKYVYPGRYERSTKKKDDYRTFTLTLYKNPR